MSILWKTVDPECYAAKTFNLVMTGRPPTGASYVIRRVRETLFLFKTINETGQYLACSRDSRVEELYLAAEEDLASGGRASPLEPTQVKKSKPKKERIKDPRQGELF